MNKWLISLISIIIALLFCGSAISEARNLPIVNIGIVLDGKWARNTDIIELFKKEMISVNKNEFDVRFPMDKFLDGNWTVNGINSAIDRLFADPNVDAVITMGHLSSQIIAKRTKLPKPVIAPFIIDAELQRLPRKEGVSGVRNLNYIDSFKQVGRDIRAFREITAFSSLAVFVDKITISIQPKLRLMVEQLSKENNIQINIVEVDVLAQEAIDSLPPSTDAVLVPALLRFPPEEFQKLIDGLNEKNLPTSSIWNYDDVERGILATMIPKDNFAHLARNVAVNLHDILRGTDAGTLNVIFMPSEQLTINMETARAIDVHPTLSIRTDADLLHEERTDIERVLTLEKVVHEALIANLDLAAAKRRVAAGSERVSESRSRLLPQIGIGSEAVIIDEDTAGASAGRQPERSWTGSASFSQLLYSERAWSGYATEKHLQDARVEEGESVRLDIIREAATAYLNVLRAKTIERIQKNNLRLTRSNLERASVRVSVGIAAPDEIYRWESEIANQRQAVLEAESGTMTAMNVLNRILDRPIQEEFIPTEIDADDPIIVLSDKMYYEIVSNPKYRNSFRNFMVKEALGLSPELRRIEAELAAQERLFTATKRDFWIPEFSLRGSATELLAEDGEGLREESVLDIDNTEWFVGVFATFPLFTSGQKTASYRRAHEEVERLKIERDAEVNRIESRVLATLNLTRSSYPSIELARDSAEAAEKNLDLITDSYERGIKSIIDLVDAQNLALVAHLNSANSIYDFLIDLVTVQRAVGGYGFMMDEEERQEWRLRFHTFAEEASSQKDQ